jgi:hypothetical protein
VLGIARVRVAYVATAGHRHPDLLVEHVVDLGQVTDLVGRSPSSCHTSPLGRCASWCSFRPEADLTLTS